MFRYDGRLVHLVATHGWSPRPLEDAARLYPGPPNPAMLSGRAILSGQVQTIVDTRADPTYDPTTARVGQWRRMIGAPMLKDGHGGRRDRGGLARTRRDAAAAASIC